MKVFNVVGARPNFMKIGPLHRAFTRSGVFESVIVHTGQHYDERMSDVFFTQLGLPKPDIFLGVGSGTHAAQTARIMIAFEGALMEHRPDLVLVVGDVNSTVACTLVAAKCGVPVAHVEAGLRSFDLSSPFPEEVNRRVATCTATVHFAPTSQARDHLISEGIPEEDVVITGNTVVDALQMIPRMQSFATSELNRVPWDRHRVALVTVHRRESLGAPLDGLCDAFLQLVERHPTLHLVFPVHLNPRVRDVVHARLAGHPRITLLAPLAYPELLEVMRRCTLILSDSGGIQEEAPSVGKPILILRDCTERPEVIEAGFGELVGTDPRHVVARVSALLNDAGLYYERTRGHNPFGDGHAAVRIAQTIEQRLRFPSHQSGPRRLDHSAVNDTLGRLAIAS